MKTRHVILTVLATLVIFTAGAFTGARLASGGLTAQPTPLPLQQPQGPMAWRIDQFARMVRELDLDPPQRQRINRLIGDRQEYIADLIGLIDPELHELFPKLRREVNEVLRPEQRQELERMFRLRANKMGERRGMDGSGTPPRNINRPLRGDGPMPFPPRGPQEPHSLPLNRPAPSNPPSPGVP